ncbi:hypothetical protein KJ682_13790 [bacterium]|nr:hypothetical protein [bacterium]
MKIMRTALMSMALILIAGQGLAQMDFDLVKVPDGDMLPLNFTTDKECPEKAVCCRVGNRNDWGYTIENFVSGGETYSYMWEVLPTCGFETGFYAFTAGMALNFGPEDVPVTLEVSAAFEETHLDGGQLKPGPVICESPIYSGTVTEPGYYRLIIPLKSANCACAEFGWYYAASITFHNRFENKPDLIVDYFPVGGTSWIDQGNGYYDLQQSYELPGEVKLLAKVDACSTPVADDQQSFGSLKALFR